MNLVKVWYEINKTGKFWFLFLFLEVYALNYHSIPFLLKAAIREKVINDRKGFSCGYCLIIVKVTHLIYGKNGSFPDI
jgi:hypothetical protein